MLPRFATFCSRMTSMRGASVLIGIGQQRKEARALDRTRQLALIEALGPGDTARHDLAGLADKVLQRGQVLVIDHRRAFGGKAAEFLAPCEAGHVHTLTPAPEPTGSPSSSSSRSRCASLSCSAFAIGEGSVIATSTLVTRCRSTASLKRNAPTSSSRVFWSDSILSST